MTDIAEAFNASIRGYQCPPSQRVICHRCAPLFNIDATCAVITHEVGTILPDCSECRKPLNTLDDAVDTYGAALKAMSYRANREWRETTFDAMYRHPDYVR